MLLVNGEIVDLSGRQPIEKEIAKYKKDLENEVGWPIVFRFPENLFVKLSNGTIQTPGPKRFATKINFHGDKGTMEMMYCKRYWQDPNDNLAHYPNKIIMDRTLIVNEEDWDLAVFLRYYYPQYGYKYELVNQKKIESNKFELSLAETKVRNYIHTSEDAGISESDLRSMALSYGIDSEDIMTLKNNLWETVKSDQLRTSEGYSRFLNLVGDDKLVAIKSMIHKAVGLNIIHDYKEKKKTWAYSTEDDVMGKAIMRYKDSNNSMGELANFLIENDKACKELTGMIPENPE
jgi:hypothetical protein